MNLQGNIWLSFPEFQAFAFNIEDFAFHFSLTPICASRMISPRDRLQTHVLSLASSLVALDLRVLTDEEHLAAQRPSESRRGVP